MTASHSGVTIVGSANMDIVLTVARSPKPGETVLAETLALYPGGKGLNQAVAAARSGANTSLVGAIGRDAHGESLATVIAEGGIDGHAVRLLDAPTGQAYIIVDNGGENTIVVASGANAQIGQLAEGDAAVIAAASVLLMQLELPMSVVIEAAHVARDSGTMVMLNAAPAMEISDALLDLVDVLVVNEHEAAVISGFADRDDAAAALSARVPRLVVTIGANGSLLFDQGSLIATVRPPAVTVVDTTGAGDTWCGALAASLSRGSEYVDAAVFATAAAALSVGSLGAVPSIPERADVDALLAGPTAPTVIRAD